MLFTHWSSALRHVKSSQVIVSALASLTSKEKLSLCQEFAKSATGRHTLYRDDVIEAVAWKLSPSYWIPHHETASAIGAWIVLDGTIMEYRNKWLHIHKPNDTVISYKKYEDSQVMNPGLNNALSLHLYIKKTRTRKEK